METRSPVERLLFSKIELWVLILLGLVLLAGLPLTSWLAVNKAVGNNKTIYAEAALAIAGIPDLVVQATRGELWSLTQPQLLKFDEFSGLVTYDPEREETGTLLISSYSDEHGVATVKLFDLQARRVLHEWVPPVEDINARTSYDDPGQFQKNYGTQHPMLLDDGSLILSSGQGPLARIDACGNLIWTIDRHFHHSIEMGPEDTLFVPHVVAGSNDPKTVDHLTGDTVPMRDDGFAEVALDGEIVREWSVKDILVRNGHIGMVYGIAPFIVDRIHVNDVQPIMESDGFVRKGDLAISLRHLSTVFLYRPETDEIVWMQTGPWFIQHDVDYQGEGIFTVFGNDGVFGQEIDNTPYRGHSTIWQYDQKTGEASPYLELGHADIYTESQGLHRVLENGDVFVEEQNSGLLHRVGKDRLVWSYADAQGEGRIGITHWSRYLTREEADFPWLDGLSCGKAVADRASKKEEERS